MKKRLLFLVGSIPFLAQSQITITPANIPVSGDTCRYSSISATAITNYTATGANHTWNFASLTATGQDIRKFQPSTATPYFFYFLPPKYGEKTLDSLPIPTIPGFPISIKNIYSFYRKSTSPFSSFNSEGLGLTMSGIPIGATFSDEDELYKFPLAFGNRDSTTFKLSTPSNSLIPFTYKKQGYRITEADGWGTITTPYGTAACLRVMTTQYSIDTISIPALPAGFNKFGFPNYARSYQWLTLGEHIPYLEISGTMIGNTFTPTSVKYRDQARRVSGIKEEEFNALISVFPNPANTELTIITAQQQQAVSIEIVDMQGKTVKKQLLEQYAEPVNQNKIDVSGLAKGLYILNLHNGSKNRTLKISIQ